MSIQDELFRSIEILVEKYLAKQKISKTIPSTVEGITGNTYRCNINGNYYNLKNASGVTLTVGTAVWVHIPSGLIGNAFIMGPR